MSDKFDEWWDENKDGFLPTPLMKKCFDGGYDKGYADGVASVKILRVAVVGVFALIAVFMLSGCQDRFRYPCMDKNNWGKEECQRPMCAITQTCPDQLMKAEDIKGEVR